MACRMDVLVERGMEGRGRKDRSFRMNEEMVQGLGKV